MIDLRLGDSMELLEALADESIDLVLTDPPWPTLEDHRAIGTTTRLKGQWFPVIDEDQIRTLFRELYRILRPDRHAYIVSDWASLRGACDAAEAAGFKLWTPLIWDKVHIGMGYHYRQTWEAVIFCEKGKRKLHDLGCSNVIHAPREIKNRWPCEKPEELWYPLVRGSLPRPSELPQQIPLTGQAQLDVYLPVGGQPVVLDPFCGSGSSAVAAIRAGASFLGFDIQEEALEITRDRIDSIERGGR